MPFFLFCHYIDKLLNIAPSATGTDLVRLVLMTPARDGRKFAIHSNVNISAGQGNMHIAFGVKYQTLFSGIVLYNVLKDSGIHNIELRKGLTHTIILMFVFLLYDCAAPVLYLLCDKTFRNFIAKCIRCRKLTLPKV